MRRPDEMTLLWMTRGPFAGQLVEATVAEAAQAEVDGWGETLTDRDATYPFSTPVPGKNAKAEKWLAEKHG